MPTATNESYCSLIETVKSTCLLLKTATWKTSPYALPLLIKPG